MAESVFCAEPTYLLGCARTSWVHVGRLRRALNRGRASDPIRTVRGTGYSFDERFGKDERLSKSA
jgi:hypothetical protein